ncbi:MAG: urea ABC transporter ATP-binding subunit UrtE [Methyloligellaceae bacterium]
MNEDLELRKKSEKEHKEILSVENVNQYYGAAQALKDVSLKAEIGKVTCLLGRNGVGKTTLLKAIAGQLPIESGSIKLEGKDISSQRISLRAKDGIAYVPQGREIFPLLTVKENLHSGFGTLPASERFVPEEIYDLFPVLKDMLGRRGGDLSGGQQQQLSIARALITKPKLLLLDEPTEGIQPNIIQDIERVIGLLRDRGEMAIVLVEQDFYFAQALADDFAVMDRGEIVLSGHISDHSEEDIKKHLTV